MPPPHNLQIQCLRSQHLTPPSVVPSPHFQYSPKNFMSFILSKFILLTRPCSWRRWKPRWNNGRPTHMYHTHHVHSIIITQYVGFTYVTESYFYISLRAWILFRNAQLPSVVLLKENTSKFHFSTIAKFLCKKKQARNCHDQGTYTALAIIIPLTVFLASQR